MDSQLQHRAMQMMNGSLGQRRSLRQWDRRLPPLLRPLVRAYLLGYASAVAPRVLTLVLQHATARRSRLKDGAVRPRSSFVESLLRILRGGLDLQRFPTFCALLVGGSTLLEACFSTIPP
jgi:hypothetical protein